MARTHLLGERLVALNTRASLGEQSEWIQRYTSSPDGELKSLKVAAASKTFAEKAAWEFVEKENPNFTLATMNPPLVFGPIVHYLNSLDSLNTSNQRVRDFMQGKAKDEIPDTGVYIWVDVRDLATAHVAAMEKRKPQTRDSSSPRQPNSATKTSSRSSARTSRRTPINCLRSRLRGENARRHLLRRHESDGEYSRHRVSIARGVDYGLGEIASRSGRVRC